MVTALSGGFGPREGAMAEKWDGRAMPRRSWKETKVEKWWIELMDGSLWWWKEERWPDLGRQGRRGTCDSSDGGMARDSDLVVKISSRSMALSYGPLIMAASGPWSIS